MSASGARLLLPWLALALLGGCLPGRVSGHFGAEAYYHTHDHYRVRYAAAAEQAPPAQPTLLDGPWDLVSFERDETGRPTRYREAPEHLSTYDLVRYAHVRRSTVLTAARYDLRFERPDRASAIFTRTIPLRAPWISDPLPVLMRRSVASLGSQFADGPDLLGRPTPLQLPLVRLVREGEARVDGDDAYFITFELEGAVVAAPGSEAVATTERITLVGIRPRQSVNVESRVALPVLVVFGHTSRPEQHDDEQDAFASLVRRVDFAEGY